MQALGKAVTAADAAGPAVVVVIIVIVVVVDVLAVIVILDVGIGIIGIIVVFIGCVPVENVGKGGRVYCRWQKMLMAPAVQAPGAPPEGRVWGVCMWRVCVCVCAWVGGWVGRSVGVRVCVCVCVSASASGPPRVNERRDANGCGAPTDQIQSQATRRAC